ncbi:hypothetical protein ACIBF1_19660 [Spirillospora sp. NPDC050679]
MRRQICRILLAMTAALAFVVPANGPADAETAAWQTKNVSQRFCIDALCQGYRVWVSASVKYNGSNVYLVGSVQCSATTGTGITVRKTWCGVWNNGGGDRGYLHVGVNYTVKFGVEYEGIPAGSEWDEYGRIQVTRTGYVTYHGEVG